MSDKNPYISIPRSILDRSPLEATFIVEPLDLYSDVADYRHYVRGVITTTFQIDERYLHEYRRREAELQEYFRERFAAALDKLMKDTLHWGDYAWPQDSSGASAASSSILDATPSRVLTTSTPTRSS